MKMKEKKEQEKGIQKKSSRRKYIIAAVGVLLLIAASLVFIYLTQEQKPDPASEKIIREAAAQILNKDPNELTDEDFAIITELNFYEIRRSLGTEIINNSNLIMIPKNGTELSDVQFLEIFVKLEKLYLCMIYYPENKIPKFMKFLAKTGIIDLKNRYCIDLSPIGNLSNLNELYLDISPVKNIKPLSHLVNLKKLSLNSTLVSNLEPIKGLTNLESLELGSTPVSDLKPIKKLTKLKFLNIINTQISDLEPVTKLANLQSLYLGGNSIHEIEPLKKMKNLKMLVLENCPEIKKEQKESLQKALPELVIMEL